MTHFKYVMMPCYGAYRCFQRASNNAVDTIHMIRILSIARYARTRRGCHRTVWDRVARHCLAKRWPIHQGGFARRASILIESDEGNGWVRADLCSQHGTPAREAARKSSIKFVRDDAVHLREAEVCAVSYATTAAFESRRRLGATL